MNPQSGRLRYSRFMERRRGPLHRAAGVCGGNRHEHATRHEPFGGHHFHRHRPALLADAPALAADAVAAGVADADSGRDAGVGRVGAGNHQRGEPGLRRRAAGIGGGLRRGALPGSARASANDGAGNPPRDCAEHSVGGHHHDERVSGTEPGRTARPGTARHAGGHRHRVVGAGDGDDLSAAAVS